MDIEQWFSPALELSQMVTDYLNADEQERPALEARIRNCEQMKRLKHVQSYSNVDFLQDNLPNQKINSIRGDFFVAPAIPANAQSGQRSHCYPMPYHRHDYFEMVFVLKGVYVQSINGVLHQLHQGEVCLLNPHIIHRDEIPQPSARILFLGLTSAFLEDGILRSLQAFPEIVSFIRSRPETTDQQYIRFSCPDPAAMQDLLEKIIDEDTEKLPGHHMLIKGYLVRLFCLLAADHRYTICSQSREEIEETLLQEILEYMYQHMNTLTRQELAAFFHFHPDYLNRLLIRHTGENYSSILTRMRMEKASYELTHTEKSVAQIISELGFSNRGHFNRLFREKYGMLPGQYREQ